MWVRSLLEVSEEQIRIVEWTRKVECNSIVQATYDPEKRELVVRE